MQTHVKGLKLLENGHKHSVFYIHDQNIIIGGKYRLKPGISSKLTPRQYRSETIRNEGRGKEFVTWNDNYLDQNLTWKQAAKIVPLTDKTFNALLEEAGYNSRKIHNDRSIGTEYFEHEDRDVLIEILESTWQTAYRIAYEYITRLELPDSLWIKEFEPRYKQDTKFIEPIVEAHLSGIEKITGKAPGGSGKTKVSFRISQLMAEHDNNPWKLLTVSDNIANTVQLTEEFAKFYKGQTGKRNTNIWVIGSMEPSNYRLLSAWANVLQVNNTTKVEQLLTKAVNSKQDYAIFVVNKSANRFLEIADSIGINFKKFYTILDEIQQYASETGVAKNVNSTQCAVINPKFEHLFGRKLGLSATPIDRGGETSEDAVYNDDIDKFGVREVSISEIQAREWGWICEKEVLIIPVPNDERFEVCFKEKRPFELSIGDNIHRIHPSHYIALDSIRQFIAPQKTHILLLASRIADVGRIANVFRNMQDMGWIDPEFEIIEGYAKCGTSCVNMFNRSKKAIMIATRWIGVGQDTYMCDATVPLYNPNNEWFSRQFSMRGDRISYDDKVSVLAFVEFEDKLEDNIWFRACEYISNGHVPNIISDSELREIVENNTIGSTRNPSDGTNLNSNVTLIRSNNHDPILFGQWEDLTNAIGTRKYTDRRGNSLFSEISRKCLEKKADAFLLESFGL